MAETAKDFCVVGLGGHARNKLIPALLSGGQNVVAVVTGGRDAAGTEATIFSSLSDAVVALPRQTVFLVATPPALHAAQTRMIVESGHDAVLEKPAFVTRRDAEEILALCADRGCVVLEAFMYRYTRLYDRLLRTWSADAGKIVALEFSFLIPERQDDATFRSGADIGSSVVFDIGCYPVSLLGDLGLGDIALSVRQVHAAGDLSRERVHVTGAGGGLTVDIKVGMAPAYENWARLVYRDGSKVTFQPFFYGRPGDRSVIAERAGRAATETLHDHNAFESMLGAARAEWAANQPRRTVQMIAAAEKLEGLGRELLAQRQGGSARR
jgi:predicted dehydrogenase